MPGNARIDETGKQARIARFYAPFDAAIDAAVAAAERAGRPPAILTMHSFTPYWRGTARPWQVGILYDCDERFARPLIQALEADPAGLTVGDNQPYGGGLPGDTIDRHATARGLSNALVEIRQDLIADEEGPVAWAERFARSLTPSPPSRYNLVRCSAPHSGRCENRKMPRTISDDPQTDASSRPPSFAAWSSTCANAPMCRTST